ncbi:hypothetical protein ACNAW0_21700 [Micromonospora sp. SL1-18]|uniref:hypothetical protein n=1 Tax=Micromonospora sp. SL1-18 TaxID=3399128 RepID=UPI003A4E07AF
MTMTDVSHPEWWLSRRAFVRAGAALTTLAALGQATVAQAATPFAAESASGPAARTLPVNDPATRAAIAYQNVRTGRPAVFEDSLENSNNLNWVPDKVVVARAEGIPVRLRQPCVLPLPDGDVRGRSERRERREDRLPPPRAALQMRMRMRMV